MHLTVIICAYNAAKRLPSCLQALARSTLRADRWDLIVVDNASIDGTAEVATKEWRASNVALTVLQESIPGLQHARECGVKHARGDVVLFVDDDNLVSSSYLESVQAAYVRDPALAVFGGRGIPRFETPPPLWVGPEPRYLAVGPQAKQSGYITVMRGYVYGACSAFRRHMLQEIYTRSEELGCVGRKANLLSAGDDVEVCLRLFAAGGKIYYDADATFEHCIEARRMTWEYQLRLFEGFGAANAWLGLLRRQLRRNMGLIDGLKASLAYTLAQAVACSLFSLVFKIVPWGRLPQTKRTLHLRSFAAMCYMISQRKSNAALHQKAVLLMRGPKKAGL